jgi:MarR family transcriptional regulator for hemolysin
MDNDSGQETIDVPLGKVFSELAKAYVGYFVDQLSDLPINRYYYALVVIENHEGDLNQTDLAEELYIDKASVVRMLDYLAAEDCIVRRQNPRDRRAHILELTPKALAMIPRIKQALHETNAICLRQAAEQGVGNFFMVLSQVHAGLQSAAGHQYQIHFVKHNDDH